MNVGRNVDDILRVIDALQLADAKPIATPADWKMGGEVIVGTAVARGSWRWRGSECSE